MPIELDRVAQRFVSEGELEPRPLTGTSTSSYSHRETNPARRVPQTEIARPYGLLVVTLDGDRISAMTWFADSNVFPLFGLPRILRQEQSSSRKTKR